MRLLKRIGITAAALAGALLVGTGSIPLAQQADEANELNKRVLQHVPTAMNRDSQDTPEVRV
jgi:hypothetical protein